MAGLDIDVPAAGEDSGLPPEPAATGKKKAMPTQNGLNEWVSSPQFAADREKQIQDYYDQQLARIQAKQNSVGEKWGLSDIRASYGAPTAEAQNQRMKLRQEELAGDRAREKEAFEGMSNLSQMKQAVQTRKAFNEYMEQKDYYASLSEKAKSPQEKAKYEEAALAFDKKARFLDPQSYAAFSEQDMARNKVLGADSSYVKVGPTGKTSLLAQTGPKTSDLIANANLGAQYGINVLGNRGATLGGGAPATSGMPGGGGAGNAGAPSATYAAPPPPKPGSTVSPAVAPPSATQVPSNNVLIDAGTFAQKPPEIYRGPSTYDTAPIKKRLEMDADKDKEYGGVNRSIGHFDQMDVIINRLLNNQAGLKSATGFGNSTASFRGEDTRQADSDLETLRGLISVEALQQFKQESGGVGSMTEKEWPRFEALRGNLSSNQKASEIIKTLQDIQKDLSTSKVNMVNAYARKFGRHPEGEAALVQKPFSIPKELAEQIPVGKEQSIENPKTRQTIVVVRDKDGNIRRVR